MKKNNSPAFDLASPEGRQKYFLAKAGKEIATLKKFFATNRLIINMVGKKNSGKGVYTKMFMEAVNLPNFHHLAVGDLVRQTGINHNTKDLLSTDIILDLLQKELQKHNEKTVFLDGLPRSVDQITSAVNLTDIFVLIDIPEKVMDMRMKNRVICPICQTPKHPQLLLTKYLEYEAGEYFLRCDNPPCAKARLVPKEGDKLGIEAIRERLNADQMVIEEIKKLKARKILLSASVPLNKKYLYEDYEIHDIYDLKWNGKNVLAKAKKWIFKDDNGADSYTLFPPAVVVYMMKEMVGIMNL